MKTIFNTNKPVKHNGRNGYDLSSTHAFVMRPAVLRPVVNQFTVPNSVYNINAADTVRTGSLQTAAFLNAKHELDFFFVPFSQLYSDSNRVLFGRGEHHTVLDLELAEDTFPSFPLYYLYDCAVVPYAFLRALMCADAFSRTNADFSSYITSFAKNYLGYTDASITPIVKQRISRAVCYDQGMLSNFSNRVLSHEYVGADCFQLLSTLGYGDIFPACRDIADMADNAARQSSTDNDVRFSSFCMNFRSKLSVYFKTVETSYTNPFRPSTTMVSLLPLAAYQKIFYDIYRDSVVDDSDLYLYAFSLDQDIIDVFASNTPFSREDNLNPLFTFLRPRTRMYKKDLSNGLYPDAQFGDPAALETIQDGEYNGLNVDPNGRDSSTSALSVRFALALQRYKETLMRAGTRTKDLLMSEFGVKSRYVQDTYVQYLGSFGGSLELNKVSATAETGSYSVGDLAANVFSSLSGQEINFTCNDHGIIVGIMSFLPEVLHNSFGLSPFVSKLKQFDFFHEDFENLGLQPVGSHIFTPISYNGNGSSSVTTQDVTLGFSARYNEYKQNLDLVHDSFNTRYIFPYVSDFQLPVKDGSNSNYVVVKPVEQDVSLIKQRSYMLPSVMDTIFMQADNGDPDNAHFQVILYCQIKAILPMSVLGLPQ